jgi:signal transduction histidine kinase/ligand-binding sensor domain-containing protein
MSFRRCMSLTMERWGLVLRMAMVMVAGSVPAAEVSRWAIDTWTAEEHLPSNTVRSMLQTRDGYLWVGTKLGLARFDGVRFKEFAGDWGAEQEGDLSCERLMEDTEGRLWFTVGSALVCHQWGRFTKFPFQAQPIGGRICAAMASRLGGLWIACDGRGVVHFDNGRLLRSYSPDDGMLGRQILRLDEDPLGRVWIQVRDSGEHTYWQRLDPTNHRFATLEQVIGQSLTQVLDLRVGPDGQLWLATGSGLLRFGNGQLESVADEGWWAREMVGALSVNLGGPVAVGLRGWWCAPARLGVLFHFDGGRVERWGVDEGLADSDIRALLPDRQGNVWVGYGAGGLQRLRVRPLQAALPSGGRGDFGQVDSVWPCSTGGMWVGTWNGLELRQGGAIRRIPNSLHDPHAAPGTVRNNARPVFEDRAGRLWFGSEKFGLLTVQDGQAVKVAEADWGEPDWAVHVLHEDREGRLWIGGDDRLVVKQGARFLRYGAAEGFRNGQVLGIRDGPDGSVWVGTNPGGLQCFRDGRFDSGIATHAFFDGGANPLLVEADGTVWVGTEARGLVRVRKGAICGVVTEVQGLPDKNPFCLLADEAGCYWANSVRGLFRVTARDLHAVADGRQTRLFCENYGVRDGATGGEGSGGYQPSAGKAADGRMWFPTTRGVTLLDPAVLDRSDQALSVRIEEVFADERLEYLDGRATAGGLSGREGSEELVLPPGRGAVLEFRYTANTFNAPEKVQFRHRLVGVDADWRGPSTRRLAYYTHLLPGHYRFQVEAFTPGGTRSLRPAELAFFVAPTFVQTAWFRISGAALLLGISGGLAGWRLRWQRRILLARQVAAVERERARISRDLHDDLGGSLTGIALELEAARSRGLAEGEQLAQLATEARTLALSLRELAWATNPSCDNAGSLGAFLSDLTERYCSAARLGCDLHVADSMGASSVSSRVRHQLLVILKELLVNVARHAQARSVTLRLMVDRDFVALELTDDGRGFDPESAIGGSGIANLRERARELGGSVLIRSRCAEGTTTLVRLPCIAPADANALKELK